MERHRPGGNRGLGAGMSKSISGGHKQNKAPVTGRTLKVSSIVFDGRPCDIDRQGTRPD
jgi:hypothetical protein